MVYRYLAVVFILSLFACNSSKKSKQIEQYDYTEEKVELSDHLKSRIGDWIEEGVICYGLVVMSDMDGIIRAAKPIKAKVIFLYNDKIKMKALEDVSVAPKEGCNKMGISKGETWMEKRGDLFKTEEEAISFAKTMINKKYVNE